jgi:ribosomal protein S27AE
MIEDKVYAPFTAEQQRWLNTHQERYDRHPYTCPNDGSTLVASDQWTCTRCDYTQGWAHAWSAGPQTSRMSNDETEWHVEVVVATRVRAADPATAGALAAGAVRKAVADPTGGGPGALPATLGLIVGRGDAAAGLQVIVTAVHPTGGR